MDPPPVQWPVDAITNQSPDRGVRAAVTDAGNVRRVCLDATARRMY
jgi:hypothetical protein